MEIIATVKDVETAKRLVGPMSAVPDFFRVNASHMDAASLASFTRDYGADPVLRKIPVYVDLQGAKLRVERSQPPTELATGSRVHLLDVARQWSPAQLAGAVFVSRTVLSLISAGTHVEVDDGKLGLDVLSVDTAAGSAVATVVRGGKLLPGKVRIGFSLSISLSAQHGTHVWGGLTTGVQPEAASGHPCRTRCS